MPKTLCCVVNDVKNVFGKFLSVEYGIKKRTMLRFLIAGHVIPGPYSRQYGNVT